MSRLGYERLSKEAARRRRRRLWAGRLTVAALGLSVAAAGLHLHAESSRARGLVGPTLEKAIEHDLRAQQATLSAWTRTVRQVAQPRFASGSISTEEATSRVEISPERTIDSPVTPAPPVQDWPVGPRRTVPLPPTLPVERHAPTFEGLPAGATPARASILPWSGLL